MGGLAYSVAKCGRDGRICRYCAYVCAGDGWDGIKCGYCAYIFGLVWADLHTLCVNVPPMRL